MSSLKSPPGYGVLLLFFLSGCSLAPDFTLPEITLPPAFKEEKPPAGIEKPQDVWQEAHPLEAADPGEWWKIFGDAQLDELETQAQEASPSLQAAAARVEAARAAVRAEGSTLFPRIDLGGNAVRAQPSSAGVAAFGGNPSVTLKPYTLYAAQGTASYEVDLFGRVRDNERALSLDADAQAAQYRSVLLALQADVAQLYFSLRALDAERVLLRDTVAMRREAVRIMQKRFDVGAAGGQDLSRTQSELAAAQAELTALDRSRAAQEHALAVLLDRLPSGFTFAEAPLAGMPPEIPAGLPSPLLQRRPDIAQAQAAMAAANARIGVARTAFFPLLVLTASGGYESTSLSDLFLWPNRTWALGQLGGAALSWTIFDSGRNIARVDAADARYREAVANYRQQVLIAFRDVEDTLSGQRLLAEQSRQQDAAAAAARRTTELVWKRYDQGDVNFFEVVDAQRGSLAAERGAIQTRGQRFLAAVALIRALGGGWQEP